MPKDMMKPTGEKAHEAVAREHYITAESSDGPFAEKERCFHHPDSPRQGGQAPEKRQEKMAARTTARGGPTIL